MVMKLHTGVPGAGKSYLLIKSFTDNFCRWDKDENEWQLRALKSGEKPIRLISNIEGLTLEHKNLDIMISERCQALARKAVLENFNKKEDKPTRGRRRASEKEDVEPVLVPDDVLANLDDVAHAYYLEFMQERTRWFFNDEYQQSLAVDCQLIYLIEESQRYFDSAELGRKPWVRDVLYFFERHRHHGVSMFLDTQHSTKLHKGIVALFEEEIRAKPRTLSVMGEFRYNSYSDGSKTNQVPIVVKPDKRIFGAYQSMTANEAVKPKKPLLKLAVFIIFVFVASYGVFKYATRKIGGSESVPVAESVKHHPVPVRPSSGSVVSAAPGSVPGVELVSEAEPVWERLDHVMLSDNTILVIHPVYDTVIFLDQVDFDVKVVGATLYYRLSSDETEKKKGLVASAL